MLMPRFAYAKTSLCNVKSQQVLQRMLVCFECERRQLNHLIDNYYDL